MRRTEKKDEDNQTTAGNVFQPSNCLLDSEEKERKNMGMTVEKDDANWMDAQSTAELERTQYVCVC